MSQTPDPRRRLVARNETRKIGDPIRQTVTLTSRTGGLLSYYAKTRGLTESMVVEQALAQLFRGWRIGDPGASAGEGEAAA